MIGGQPAVIGRERRQLVAICSAVGIVCFAISWMGSAPHVITGLQWDTGTYMARFATTSNRWRQVGVPWTSHLGLPQLYITFAALAELVGGTTFDGFRLLQALSVAVAGVLFFLIARRLAGDGKERASEALAALLALAFVTAWGIMTFVFAMVDNLVYLPPALGVLLICVDRVDAWRDRDSVVAGALAGVATLVSLQCVIYVLPPLFVAALLGGPRRLLVRARQAVLVAVVFVAILPLWGLVLAATTATPMRTIFAALFARPQASFVPKDANGVRAAFDLKLLLRHLGMGIAQELTEEGQARLLYNRMPSMGVWLLVVEVLAFVAALVAHWRKRAGRHLVLITFTLLAFTLVTSLYHDRMSDKYKRYDFLPLLVFLAVAALVGNAGRWRRWMVRIALPLMALVIVAQSTHAVGINRHWHENLPFFPKGLNDYCGRDNVSWMGYFEKVRRQRPDACRFIFAIDEFKAIRYNNEVTAAMATQLPAFALIGVPTDIVKFKAKPPLIAPAAPDAAFRACDWISPIAEARRGDR